MNSAGKPISFGRQGLLCGIAPVLVVGRRHIPFMAKVPGQTTRRNLREPIRLADFERIPGFPLGPARKGE
ncbi:MAG: hypothetical protein EOM72_07995 [Opitutae bacterium]|nr:hypothetical protein [Opitutae bacterium]